MLWSLLPSSCSRKDWMIGARMWNYKLRLHPLQVTSYKLQKKLNQRQFYNNFITTRNVPFLQNRKCFSQYFNGIDFTDDDTEDVNKLDDNGVPVTAESLTCECWQCNSSSVTQAAACCLGSSLLGPCWNRQAALISLRSGPLSQAEQLTMWTLACYLRHRSTQHH